MCIDPLQFHAALANDTRLRALVLLVAYGELCVCDLTEGLGLSQPHISRHLARLRKDGLVQDRRAGHWVYYRLDEQLPAWAAEILRLTAEGAGEREPFRADAVRLAAYLNEKRREDCSRLGPGDGTSVGSAMRKGRMTSTKGL